MVTKLVLDTNSLLSCIELGINIDVELSRVMAGEGAYQIIMPCPMLEELDRLGRRGERNSGIAFKLIERLGVIAVETEQRGDLALIEIAEDGEDNVIVFTNDKALRAELKGMGIKTLFVRGKGHLEIEKA